jgi:predicted permease
MEAVASMSPVKPILRRLLRTPGFTAVVVATLAISFGANIAIFAVLNGVLLKPLPYPDADRLISMNHTAPGIDIVDLGSSPYLYFTEREENETLEAVGLWGTDTASVTGVAEPERVRTLGVTQEILPMLRVAPLIGRYFTEQETSPGGRPTVILTYGYWQRRFGGDPSVAGKTLTVDGEPREIIGVMPRAFRWLDRQVDLIRPLAPDRNRALVGNYLWNSIARMKPGVTLQQVRDEVARMIPIANAAFPLPPGTTREDVRDMRIGPHLRTLKREVVGDIGNTLWVIMGTITIVLLIACANVTNLLLVRAEERRQEMAIRGALGASWARIARDFVLEAAVLGAAGGVLGVALAYAGLRSFLALAPATLPRLAEIAMHPPVLAFAFAVSLLSGVLLGLIPAIRHAGARFAARLHAAGRPSSASRRQRRIRGVLVTVQVALALVLMVGAGLMIRTFQALVDIEPGFARPAEVLEFDLAVSSPVAKDAKGATRLKQDMLDRIGSVAGVTSAAFGTSPPLGGDTIMEFFVPEDGASSERSRPEPELVRFKFVSPGFFATTGTQLIAGRDVTWADAYEMRHVALVSENLARAEWGSPTNALGKRLRGSSSRDEWREIVGVVEDVRDDGITRRAPEIIYLPAMTRGIFNAPALSPNRITVLVRSPRTGTPAFLEEIRAAVWSVDASLPLANVRSLEDDYARSLARTSLTLMLLAIAGTIALLLGVVGVYGVIAYAVAQRTREIGIRIALGARDGELRRLFVRHAIAFGALGIGFGLAAAAVLSPLMSSLLFGVSALDASTYIAASAALLGAVALASYLPARRATQTDPCEALRAE